MRVPADDVGWKTVPVWTGSGREGPGLRGGFRFEFEVEFEFKFGRWAWVVSEFRLQASSVKLRAPSCKDGAWR